MGMTLQDLRDDVYEALGMDSDDLSQAKVDQYLNRSYWEITKKLKFRENDQQFTLTLVPDQSNYAFTSYISDFDAIRHVAILDTLNSATQWGEVQQTDYDNLMNCATTDNINQACPVRYARFGDEIVFSPTPTYAYSVRISYRRTLGDILTNGPSIPDEWDEIISYGAIARAWRGKGSPMRGSDIARVQAEIISTMVSTESKEDRDYARSSASILRARYP
jgi:hypothetical protein